MRHVRVLSLERDADLLHDLSRQPVRTTLSRESRSRCLMLKLSDVDVAAAAPIPDDVVLAYGEEQIDGTADIILAGSREKLLAIGSRMDEQPKLRGIAAEILAAIRNWDTPPALPVSTELIPRLRTMYEMMQARTLVMGILNVTPDSFSDGGTLANTASAVGRALTMVDDGADIVDIGGESTRPGAQAVSADQEIDRVVPVIADLRRSSEIPISVDTSKAAVAKAALDAGADIVNDISAATFDPEMPALLAARQCPVVLMHIKGTPRDMQSRPEYRNVMDEVYGFLAERVRSLAAIGVDERLLIIDPGIGFGKTVEHNLELMRRLREFTSLGRPVLIGTSRKSTIGKVLGDLPIDQRLEGTAATVAVCITNGAGIVRVHDVLEMTRVARMTDAIVRPRRQT